MYTHTHTHTLSLYIFIIHYYKIYIVLLVIKVLVIRIFSIIPNNIKYDYLRYNDVSTRGRNTWTRLLGKYYYNDYYKYLVQI